MLVDRSSSQRPMPADSAANWSRFFLSISCSSFGQEVTGRNVHGRSTSDFIIFVMLMAMLTIPITCREKNYRVNTAIHGDTAAMNRPGVDY